MANRAQALRDRIAALNPVLEAELVALEADPGAAVSALAKLLMNMIFIPAEEPE